MKTMANRGRNYWTFEPFVAATFRPTRASNLRKFMYDFYLKNSDTN
jgi:hypothetical protein